MVLLLILLLALARPAECATGADVKRRSHDGVHDISATISGRYVVILRPKDDDFVAAAERFMQHVQQARAAMPRRAALTSTSEHTSNREAPPSKPTFAVLSTFPKSSVAASSASSGTGKGAAAAAASTSSVPARTPGTQGLVVQASPDLLKYIKDCEEVSAMFADRVVAAQVAGPNCVQAHSLSKSTITSRAVNANFKWPGCLTSNTQLAWVGQRCRDMSRIQYVAIYAVDKSTGAVRLNRGKECVLRPDVKQAGWSAQRFGSCGKAPAFASDLPTTVCSSSNNGCLPPTNSDPAAPAAAAVVTAGITLSEAITCKGKAAKRLTYTGQACGPSNAFIQWTQARTSDGCLLTNPNVNSRLFSKLSNDVFGSCGVPPGKAADAVTGALCARAAPPTPPPVTSPPVTPPVEVLESPNVASPIPFELPSPSPDPSQPSVVSEYAGPRLPRIPVAAGEDIPAGIARIEAATDAGVASTTGLPVEQRVVVAVVDSGVDRTHPDLTYAGGQSWITDETAADSAVDSNAPDVDLYGHGTHVAGIIAANNDGQGVVGVSPGAPIYSLKVLDAQGRGSLANMLAAVKWVATEGVQQGIKVINLSLAAYIDPSSEDYQAVYDTVCSVFQEASDAGVFTAAAAGNYVANLQGYFPATCLTVAAVTAIDPQTNAPASFSNYLDASDSSPQEQAHVIAAPGVGIRSTISFAKDPSGYRQLSGTSQAVPHVVGIVANCLMSQACTGSTGADHLATLQSTALLRANIPGGPFSGQYGFQGDLRSATNSKIYGNLAWSAY